ESLLWAVICAGELTVAPAVGAQMVTDGVGAALTSHTEGIGTVTEIVAFVMTLAASVLVTLMRCEPPAIAIEVLSWSELTLNLRTPSRYNCMRVTRESLAWAIT